MGSPYSMLFASGRLSRPIVSFRLEPGAQLVLCGQVEGQCLPPFVANADIPPRTCGGAAIGVTIFQLKQRFITGHLLVEDPVSTGNIIVVRTVNNDSLK